MNHYHTPPALFADHSIPPADRTRLAGQAKEIFNRLRQGPATNADLAAISLKYTSRISDLRREGHDIQAKRISGGTFEYRLVTA